MEKEITTDSLGYETTTWPKLYKKSSKGKLQEWQVRAEQLETIHGSSTTAYSVVVSHGLVGGKIQTTAGKEINEGKNLGKANYTTPEMQAMSEAESLHQKRLDKGYVPDAEEAMNITIIRPMLADKYEKMKKHINFPCYVQPKLDGARCLATRTMDGKITLFSRGGKHFFFLDHIRKEVAQLLENQYDITILDGELYSDELTFQEIMSVIKKSKTPPDPEMMAKIEYHVYDGFDTRRLDTPMKERQGLLNGMFAFASDGKFLREDTAVQQVDSWTAENEDDVSGYYDMFIQAGYEGAIVRDFSLLYKLNGRSNKLLKVKAFLDFEYRIIGAAECQGNDAGTVKWICDFGDGRTFTCRPKGTREMRRSWWINREEFMGKMLTVEFFEFTDDGLPRFPVGKGVRDYE